jgi:hypothetical protein
MKCSIVRFALTVLLLPAVVIAQTASQQVKRDTPKGKTPKIGQSRSDTIKICQNIPLPAGYVIVAMESSSACSGGAYVLVREDGASQVSTAFTVAAQRPRKVSQKGLDLEFAGVSSPSNLRQPALNDATTLEPETKDLSPTSLEKTNDEVDAGDVVRIDTNLVTVPVSVLDRQGRLIPDLSREQFKVFDNDVEQQIVHFEPTEKPFTVALMLDTSGSTVLRNNSVHRIALWL